MKWIAAALVVLLTACVSTPTKTVRSAPPEQTAPSVALNRGGGHSSPVFTDQAGTSIKVQ